MYSTQTNLPLISVIVLNFNGKGFLKDCLDSLFSLNYPKENLEIILVDNASSDGSVEFAGFNYKDVKIIKNDRNYGFAKGNNIGAIFQKSSEFQFKPAVADDFIEHAFLRHQIGLIVRHYWFGLAQRNKVSDLRRTPVFYGQIIDCLSECAIQGLFCLHFGKVP